MSHSIVPIGPHAVVEHPFWSETFGVGALCTMAAWPEPDATGEKGDSRDEQDAIEQARGGAEAGRWNAATIAQRRRSGARKAIRRRQASPEEVAARSWGGQDGII